MTQDDHHTTAEEWERAKAEQARQDARRRKNRGTGTRPRSLGRDLWDWVCGGGARDPRHRGDPLRRRHHLQHPERQGARLHGRRQLRDQRCGHRRGAVVRARRVPAVEPLRVLSPSSLPRRGRQSIPSRARSAAPDATRPRRPRPPRWADRRGRVPSSGITGGEASARRRCAAAPGEFSGRGRPTAGAS